ncbi:MAG: carbamoyl-phosphate synthase large subunit [Proteobacteria bacterium]|nr:carbamoyl-phosphate synthase large subunit [Pseudomonadota bacterium]
MPKRNDIQSVLVIGAGPIVIGQACEFDYSGTQACQALREEGIRIVLLNSNPATIMTDPGIADATYIEPVDVASAIAIIEKENIDAVLPTMGGQTALNCAMQLAAQGVFGSGRAVDGKPILIGANADSIYKAEDRKAFKQAMEKIGLQCAPSAVVEDLTMALAVQEEIGYPTIVRPSFTLGGTGGGIAYNKEEFDELVARGLAESPNKTVLLERSLIGWKEFEMEVVRDKQDNCIIICSIENIDPMGVHTGDSITVAPAQTLTDKEYQMMRDASIAVLREIGVDTGGSNVQFAINPKNGDMVVIEMNPRVSRSSALASKATGFPIAKVATKLALGYTLDEIANDITGGKTPASFEPSIDYIVTKIPRFDFLKFSPTPDQLTTQMRSVGEVMAIGRTFVESLQKALRGLDIGFSGLESRMPLLSDTTQSVQEIKKDKERVKEKLKYTLSHPHSKRIFDIGDAFRLGMSREEIHHLTHVDPWFLSEIEDIINVERNDIIPFFEKQNEPSAEKLLHWKKMGFADLQISRLKADGSVSEKQVREWRKKYNIHPVYKRIDTCAGEFPTETAYLYSTYEDECELQPTASDKKVMILGSGPNRIGQGIEFDYCCVHGVLALKAAGYETLMVNCNPETVSTDYDTADRLFFEPLTVEDVLEIIHRENPCGVIVQFGGQTPLSIARTLDEAGAPIIGTSVAAIDLAESREQFQQLLAKCELRQPDNAIVGARYTVSHAENSVIFTQNIIDDAVEKADAIGYPLVVRPSYVLGGRAMEIIYSVEALRDYFQRYPDILQGDVLLDKFLSDAVEVDVDAVRDDTGECLVVGVMEHVERAGIHSGDSACSLPPYSLSDTLIAELERQAQVLAKALQVVGLMNVQFAIRENEVYVLEVNPRASRTVPFVSKATGIAVAKIAALAMAGESLAEQRKTQALPERMPPLPYFAVKEAVFPFNKFPDVDILLGPEMKSTGESMGLGDDFATSYYLAQEAITATPMQGTVVFSVRDSDKKFAATAAAQFIELGFSVQATRGTADYFTSVGLAVETINKVAEGRPHIVDLLKSGKINIVINTENNSQESREDSFSIRRAALAGKVIYFTTMSATAAILRGLQRVTVSGRPPVQALQHWHKQIANN